MESDYLNINVDLNNCGRNDIVTFLHEQISSYIRRHDPTHELKLIPVAGLAKKLGIARQTVQKAYNLLESEHLIYRRTGTKTWYTTSKQSSLSKCIGILLPMPFTEYYMNTVNWGQRNIGFYSGIVARATELDYSTRPCYLPPYDASPEEIARAINRIAARCDGIIHFGDRGFDVDKPLRCLMERRDIPQITLDCQTNLNHIGVVCFDPDSVARNVSRFLYSKGHRNICLVYPTYRPRECGCQYNMVDEKSVFNVFKSLRLNDECFTKLITSKSEFGDIFERKVRETISTPTPPTAFWCRSDSIALELIKTLKRLGYNVPADFSVMGFDDIIPASTSEPPLTTFHNPLFEIGFHAVSQLDNFIKVKVNDENRVMHLIPHLVVRESVTAPKTLKDKFINNKVMMI